VLCHDIITCDRQAQAQPLLSLQVVAILGSVALVQLVAYPLSLNDIATACILIQWFAFLPGE
jgi:hypothetical protein